ncbi:MAG: hypothetical protein M1821_001348 [Bathelium mastoideum]|nr:MAG: hypothetical protein M1821_001348 [Bathelium mastoideum]
MASSPPASSSPLSALIDLTTAVLALTSQFTQHLASSNPSLPSSYGSASSNFNPTAATSPHSATSAPSDPLPTLRTTATLLRAHLTKLGLLLLPSTPFTPTALRAEVHAIAADVLPVMVAAAETMAATTTGNEKKVGGRYGRVLSGEVRGRVAACVREVEGLMGKVRARAKEARDGGEGRDGERRGEEEGVEMVTEQMRRLQVVDARVGGGGRDAVASTGVGWEACDAVVEVVEMGLKGVVVKKVEEWREVLKDAAEELKEWGEDGEVGEDRDDMDNIFGVDKLPKGHEELRTQLDVSLKKVKLVVTLYQAIIKRRLKTLPAASDIDATITHRVDGLAAKLKDLPDMVDEMASSFYDLDEKQAQKNLDAFGQEAQAAIRIVSRNWQGQEDEFTEWSGKWLDVFDKTARKEAS